MAPNQGYYEYIRSNFISDHSTYPVGVSPNNKIDGAGYPFGQRKQIGFADPRNPLRHFWTYPNYEASRLINKDKRNWQKCWSNVLDKDKQMDLMEEKLIDDHLFLTPQYKQVNTKKVYPKINYIPGAIQNL